MTLSRTKGITQTMSGLIVSDNKKVAILFKAEDPAKDSKKDKDGNMDTTIYAFDLQVGHHYIYVTAWKTRWSSWNSDIVGPSAEALT